MDIRLDGRCALITGASQGLGLAMSVKFAAAGAKVAMVARTPGPLEAARAQAEAAGSPGAALAVVADISTAEGTEAAYQAAKAGLGKIDILVNNAGGAKALPFEEASDETWQADLDLKLFAAIRLSRLCLPDMKAQRWGRIINVLNSFARTPGPRSAPTSVSRAAGLALTKVLASELAPHNVLVNAMLTGTFKTEQIRRAAGDKPLEDWYATLAKRIPLGRVGEPEEFANLALFLVSDAGGYITGAGINTDGGQAAAP
ncbi:MAG: SDR family oxidoreductase [Caulobacteraceae bacterium]|nr:SDR family oxidoreductase [Caulobacteraceae bacterium]